MLEQLKNKQMRVQIQKGALPKKAPAKKSSAETGVNLKCTNDENDFLLDVIEEILPIGKFPWEKVGVRYNRSAHKTQSRTVENLRKHFNVFVNKKPPTGDPDCPPLVVRTKRIDRMIKDKAGLEAISAGDPAPNFEDGGDATGIAEGTTTTSAINKKPPPPLECGDTAELIEAMIASEKLTAEREDRREERRHKEEKKREAKKEKLRCEDNKQWMQMGIMALNALAPACTGKENVSVPGCVLPSIMPAADDLSSSTANSDSDCDFEEHKRRRHQKRSAKKRRVKWQETNSERKNRAARKALIDLKEKDLFVESPEKSAESAEEEDNNKDSGFVFSPRPHVPKPIPKVVEKKKDTIDVSPIEKKKQRVNRMTDVKTLETSSSKSENGNEKAQI